MASLVERNEAGLVDAGRSRGQPRRRGHDDEPRLSACPARLRMRGLCGRGGTQALSQVPSSRRVSGEILNKVETLSLYRAREAAPMNTVKWRGLRMVAVAVAGFVLLAAILAVSPDASESGRSGSDTTPPGRSDGSPTGTLPAGTTSATLSLKTDEAATCRYSTAAGVACSRTRDTLLDRGRGNRGREHVHVLCAVPRPLPEREPGRLPDPVLCTIRGRLRYSIRERVRCVDACRRGVRSLVLRARRDLDVRSEPES